MNVVVILSDDEAENVASILRRMNERVEDAEDHTVAYVDDRGPNDFANQLEALVDAGDETVYVPLEPFGRNRKARYAFVTGNAARTFAAKADADGGDVADVTLVDPNDGIPDP